MSDRRCIRFLFVLRSVNEHLPPFPPTSLSSLGYEAFPSFRKTKKRNLFGINHLWCLSIIYQYLHLAVSSIHFFDDLCIRGPYPFDWRVFHEWLRLVCFTFTITLYMRQIWVSRDGLVIKRMDNLRPFLLLRCRHDILLYVCAGFFFFFVNCSVAEWKKKGKHFSFVVLGHR